MLRPWPAYTTPSLAVLSLLLACSSAGTDQLTGSSTSESDTGNLTSTSEPSPTDSNSTPTTSSDPTTLSTGEPGNSTGVTTSSEDTSTTLSTASDTSTAGESSTSDSSTGTTGDTTGDTTGTTTGTTGDSSSSTGDPPEGCVDGVKNGDETDVDCGGSCDGCAVDLVCVVDGDCASLSCDAGICVEASCEDSKQNGSETDIDCGGDCNNCLDGDSCAIGEDCESGVCAGDICQPPACNDDVPNGDETDIDCGGSCEGCAVGEICLVDADCADGNCDSDVCVGGSCDDGILNAGEAGIDCGGPSCAPCELVINEVDYDQAGDDLTEFVEILNKEASPVSLADLKLVLVNGSNNTTVLSLGLGAGTLMPGQYLVVGTAALGVPPTAVKVNFAKAKDNIENGAPDGVALVDATNKKLLDAFSYEGSITMAKVTGLDGNISLVEGVALGAGIADSNMAIGSLSRLPDGTDTNNAATDWAFTTSVTPGLANVP